MKRKCTNKSKIRIPSIPYNKFYKYFIISEAHLINNSYCNINGYVTYQCYHPNETAHIITLNNSTIKTRTIPTLTPGITIWSKFHSIIENQITLNIPHKIPSDMNSIVIPLTSKIQNSSS